MLPAGTERSGSNLVLADSLTSVTAAGSASLRQRTDALSRWRASFSAAASSSLQPSTPVPGSERRTVAPAGRPVAVAFRATAGVGQETWSVRAAPPATVALRETVLG